MTAARRVDQMVSRRARRRRPRPHGRGCGIRERRLPLVTTLAALVTLGALAGSWTATAQAQAPQGCDYAQSGSGTYADTICWIDFSAFDNTAARSPAGQPMSISLPGGYTATFNVQARPVPGMVDISSCIEAEAVPFFTAPAAWPLGGRGYTGIAGKPGLLNTNGVSTPAELPFPLFCRTPNSGADLILANIQVTRAGQPVSGYGIASTESEATIAPEGIVWNADTPLTKLDQFPANATGGCINNKVTGFGTTTVTCANAVGGNPYGTTIVFAESPTTFSTASIRPSGILGTAYGFVTSKIRLNKTIDQLRNPTDSFNLAVSSGGATVGSGSTGGALTGSTGEVTILTGGSFTLAESAAAGTTLSDYRSSWACERNGVADPSLSSTGDTSKSVTPGVGDFIDCTVTNTLLPFDVAITKTASDERVTIGDTVTYTLTARNAGPSTAPGQVVTDEVPGELDVTSATTTQGTCSVTANAVNCPIGTLASGQSVTVTVRAVAIDAGQTANVAVLEPPPPPTPILPSTTPTPAPTPAMSPPAPVRIVKPTLHLSKRLNRTTLRVGRPATYTIRVRNRSNAAVRDVTTCDRLPSGLVYVSSNPRAKLRKGKYCWTARSLGADKSKTYKLTVRILRGASGAQVNRASAGSPNARAARAKRTVRVRRVAVRGGGVTG
jgi:uncharacterized repeat protein (TIGR01451 family)